MITQYLLLILGLGFLTRYLWNRRKYYLLSLQLPAEIGLPFIGIAHRIRNVENVLVYAERVRNKCHDRILMITWLGPIPLIWVSQPDLMKKIMLSSDFTNKSDFYELVGGVMNGLFLLKGLLWTKHRKLINPAFNLQVLKNFLPIFNKQTSILIRQLSKNIDTEKIEIMKCIQKCILEVTFQTTTAKEMHFQLNENSDFMNAYITAVRMITKKILNPIYHLDIFFRFTDLRKTLKKCELTIKNQLSQILSERENEEQCERNNNSKESKEHNFLIDLTLDLHKNNIFTLMEVIDELNGVNAAAFETTSNTITYTLILLAMFPEYQEKLFQELYTVFPQRNDFEVTYEDLQKLTYLGMVINETMRFMAPFPFLGRAAAEDFTITEDIVIPKGAQVILDIFSMQRDERFWGTKAKHFYPDHFLPKNFEKIHPFAYVPFAKGDRNCIGWRYAILIMKLVLAKIIRTFKVSTDFKFTDLEFVFNVNVKLKKMPSIYIHHREL